MKGLGCQARDLDIILRAVGIQERVLSKSVCMHNDFVSERGIERLKQ